VIDLRAARADPERFRAAVARRGAGETFDELLAADARWRELVPLVDDLRARQKIDGRPTPDQIEELKRLKDELRAREGELAEAQTARDELLLRIPNIPDESVPDGTTEEDAAEVRRVGDPPTLENPREHTEVGRFDMERAARIAGARFGYWIGDTALLALALYRLGIDRLTAKGFVPVLPPVLLREEALLGTGQLPSLEDNIYEVPADELYLAGTAEIPLGGLHRGEILAADELPLRYVGFSPSFRREAGAAGKDTRGMFRVHQFNKVEMFVFVEPGTSWDEHERMLDLEERFLQALELPYRVMNVAAGDLGASAAKKYDIEAWFPFQERYREVTSCSNTTDYQSRRLGIRYRTEHGLEHPHTLNGTMVTDRALLAILENFQGGVPDVLTRYGAPAAVSPP
jgi:seryl-tRNA synthetase